MNISLTSPLRTHRRLLKPTDHPHVFDMYVDNTAFENETTCPRKAEHYLVFGRQSASTSALSYGQAIHLALERIIKGEELEAILPALRQHFDDNPVDFREWRTFDHCVEALKGYIHHWGNHKFDVLMYEGSPFVEKGFKIPFFSHEVKTHINYPPCLLVEGSTDDTPAFYVDHINVFWTGRIDLITHYMGDVWAVDHKTTSMAGSGFWKDFLLSSQMMGYTWATQQLGIPTVGVIINAIIGRQPTKSGEQNAYDRQNFTYTKDQIEEWYDNTADVLSTFVTRLVKGFFPMATKWCLGKYGTCPFHDVCSTPMAGRSRMLMSDLYTDVHWNPLAESEPIQTP